MLMCENLLHIFRVPTPKNTYVGLLLLRSNILRFRIISLYLAERYLLLTHVALFENTNVLVSKQIYNSNVKLNMNWKSYNFERFHSGFMDIVRISTEIL